MRPAHLYRVLLGLVTTCLLTAECGPLMLPIGRDEAPTDGGVAAKRPDARVAADVVDGPNRFGATADSGVGGITPQRSCTPDVGWSWCNPSPTGVTLDAVWGSAADDVWAVGAAGMAEHWDGGGWSVVPTPTVLELFSVWGSSSTDVWAVGSNAHGANTDVAGSVILHWNGSAWSEQAEDYPALWSVWGSDSTHVWAVGAASSTAALILFGDGVTWTPVMNVQTATVLSGVWGSDAGHIWAVGNTEIHPDGGAGNGTYAPLILSSDGTTWGIAYNNGNAATTALPLAVWGTSSSDVWVATGGDPLHWNNVTWEAEQVPGMTTGPTTFGGFDTDTLWGPVGQDMALWNGMTWSESPVAGIGSPGSVPLTLTSVWASSSMSAWAVGVGGALVSFDGTGWTAASPMPELLSTWASTPTDAWAVGDDGTALHWDGSLWSPASSGSLSTLTAVWGASSTDVWTLAADSTVRRGDATGFIAAESPSSGQLASIGGTGSEDVWIGGASATTDDGELYHWTGSWTTYPVPVATTSLIESLWVLAPDDVWAVGYEAGAHGAVGLAVHWNGVKWTVSATPSTTGATEYTSVWGSGTDDVWAAGPASGSRTAALIHWNGTGWSDVTLLNLAGVRSLWGSGPNDVWLWASFVGSLDEQMMHWDGTSWSPSYVLPDVWSYGTAISGTGPNDLWTVGSGGMILHHHP